MVRYEGDSWSPPTAVDDEPAATDANQAPDATNVGVAVNRSGVVGVIWGDRREHADDHGWRFRFAASVDGGDTFTPSVKLASGVSAFDRAIDYPFQWQAARAGRRLPLQLNVAISGFLYSSGHTVGITTDDAGRFHPVWCDNRTGVSQLWTAAVTVDGAATRNGIAALADLDDVTELVEATLQAIRYDRTHNRGELTLRLRNVSERDIAGPLTLRVVNASGQMGRPVFDGLGDAGIVVLGDGTLTPNGPVLVRALPFYHRRPSPTGARAWLRRPATAVREPEVQSVRPVGGRPVNPAARPARRAADSWAASCRKPNSSPLCSRAASVRSRREILVPPRRAASTRTYDA